MQNSAANKLNRKFSKEEALEQVIHEVGLILTSTPPVISEYTGHLASSVGKFIRAASVITCGMDEDGKIGEKAVKMAAAVEILHLATLVHDDVIDDADLRRGRQTLQKKYGKRTAVICGDYLVILAMKLAASAWDKSEMEEYIKLEVPDYVSRVCLGELNQHINSGNLELSVRKYLRIISGKTAALFEASFFTGAALVEKDRRIIRKYARLGHNIGMIFQLTDDCMDFEETEEAAQKPVRSDFEQNVITLPLIFALKNLEGYMDKAKKRRLSRMEVDAAVRRAGGLDYTWMVAKKYYTRSRKLIGELDICKEKRKELEFILDKAYRIV